MVGESEALVLEVVGDAAGPDRILVRVLRRLLAEVKLRADVRDAADAEQDAVQALVERVAVVAVEEDQRLVLLQLPPEVREQCRSVGQVRRPSRTPCPSGSDSRDVELFVLADDAEVLLPHPAVR